MNFDFSSNIPEFSAPSSGNTPSPRKTFNRGRKEKPSPRRLQKEESKAEEEALIKDYMENCDLESIFERVALTNMPDDSDVVVSDDASTGWTDDSNNGSEVEVEDVDILDPDIDSISSEYDSDYSSEGSSQYSNESSIIDSEEEEGKEYDNEIEYLEDFLKTADLDRREYEEIEAEISYLKRRDGIYSDASSMTSSSSGYQAPKKGKGKKNKIAKGKKKAKAKEEAAENRMRAQELNMILKQNGKQKVDAALFAYLTQLNNDLRKFATDRGRGDNIYLPAMPAAIRKYAMILCKSYNTTPALQGSKKKKSIIAWRTKQTRAPDNWKEFVNHAVGGTPLKGNTTMEFTPQKKAKGNGIQAGEVVGSRSPAIGTDNVGNQMLRMMGWSPGDPIGPKSKLGAIEPVKVVIRSGRSGL